MFSRSARTLASVARRSATKTRAVSVSLSAENDIKVQDCVVSPLKKES